jgi:poly(3-hydroxybutyrate) depolymerase
MTGVHVVGIAPCSATLAESELAQSTTSVSGTTERIEERSYQFEEAGLPMEYQLYVPTTYDAATPSPLLVLLHGAGVYPGQIIRYQGFTDLAEERGYIVVAPMGYIPQGGYGTFGGRPSELSERDVMNVLELTLEEFNVDRDRVYLAGHSMGGQGTFHLAIKYPDIWAALGPVDANVNNLSLDGLPAITHIPVIWVQGTASPERAPTWVAKMAELGMTYRYIEVPGEDHFSIIDSDPDNVQAIFDFFDQARRD